MPVTIEIAGRVADASSGLAVAGVQVEARDAEGRAHEVLARADTDAGGAFLLRFERSTVDESATVDERATAKLNPTIGTAPGAGRIEPEPPGPGAPRGESVHLKVLRDGGVLPSEQDSRWDGRPEVLLLVDASVAPPPPPPPPPPRPIPAPPTPTAALTIVELGEALAATAASIQQELAHYPTASGGFVLDDLDLEIPAGFGVDTLGQLRVRMGDDVQPASAGRLRLRVKPLLEPPGPRSVTAPQALDSLEALSPEVIRRLEAERVYCVGDLLRVSRNPAGRRALEQLGVPDLAAVRGRAELIALPTVPPRIAESLIRIGVHEPRTFVDADPEILARDLQARLGETLDADDVAAWQARTRPLVTLERPGKRIAEPV